MSIWKAGNIMLLYHGTTMEVQNPRIILHEIGRDFGPAFYTTEIKAQAERWAKRRAMIEHRKSKNAKAIVNVYEWNIEESLSFKNFETASMEWIDMIVNCRTNNDYAHGFDIVRGKIANDNVGETISYVTRGIMRKEDALERLKFEKINSQTAFCTEIALNTLTFLNSYEVR